ncbi:MAG TPA: hypothetical protein VF832_14655, partial [Longimicrobiales bacterium]
LVKDGQGKGPRWLDGLFISPKGAGPDFTPNGDNWRRRAKAPVLVLNATTLNTGHNWQFTASWMGEPPPGGDDTDGNERLRRMWYREAPTPYRHMRLGHAVAASACVPALFQPLALDGLYPEREIRLVDGGVHDNQGIASLLEQDCAVIIVSDASGQMTDRRGAGRGPLSTPFRSNSILMARVREAQIAGLWSRLRSGLLRDLAVVHLRKGLPAASIDWVDCQEPKDPFEDLARNGGNDALTSYGIRRDLQGLLANVRTDLDSFCDAEAYALMLSGYRQLDEALRNGIGGLQCADAPRHKWRFQVLDHALSTQSPEDPEPRRIQRILSVAGSRAFKVWQLRPVLATSFFGALVVLAVLLWKAGHWQALWAALPGNLAARWFMVVVALLLVLSGVAWLHGRFFDRLYLRFGRVKPAPGS